MKSRMFACGLLTVAISTAVFAKSNDKSEAKNSPGLKNAVVLVIRHGEKPESGDGLTPVGEQRARLYPNYFKNYTVDSALLKLDYLFAAADSKNDHRPRLTIEPLSRALGIKIDGRFEAKQFAELAAELRDRPHGKRILICWHHGEIPNLLQALGADPAQVLPVSEWPGEVFGWVIQLRYDENGNLIDATRIDENLMPDDSASPH